MISSDKKVRVWIDSGRADQSTWIEGKLTWQYAGKADESVELKSDSGKSMIVPPRRIVYVEVIS